jgi:uncharacterized membrane protein (DUF106 family)
MAQKRTLEIKLKKKKLDKEEKELNECKKQYLEVATQVFSLVIIIIIIIPYYVLLMRVRVGAKGAGK